MALGSGLAWGACFGQKAPAVLGLLALAPLIVLLGRVESRARVAALSWLHGIAAWSIGMQWLMPTLHRYGGLSWPLASSLLLLLAAFLGLYHCLFGVLAQRVLARPWLALLVLPALWVSLEWVRSFAFTGFPWNVAAHAALAVPGALPSSAWWGAFGVSFWVLAVNTAVALAVLNSRRFALVAASLLLPMALAWWWSERPRPEVRAAQPVALVQPNTPIVYTRAEGERNYRKLRQLTRCRGGELIIWPESASFPLIYPFDELLRNDVEALADRGCSVLFNSSTFDQERAFNSALLVSSDAAGPGRYRMQRYDKLHLVPYGEYVPLGEVLPFVGRLARAAGDFSPGSQLRLLETDGEQLGVSVCYEIVFPAEVAERVAAGASVLVTITNDAWYGDTAAPWQHLAAARFRAAENRRPVLRAALTGVSAVIDEWGAVTHELGVGETGVIDAEVSGGSARTPFSRAPWLVPWLSTVLALFAILWCRFRPV